MEFTSPRATFEETLAFANAVREAGGGAPLDALMPAVPTDSSKCLIARNLNFNCTVAGDETFVKGDNYSDNYWRMTFDQKSIRDAVAERLGLVAHTDEDYDVSDGNSRFSLRLPVEIGNVAAEFDRVDELAEMSPSELSEDEKQRIDEFMPYIEASARDAYNAAYVINEDGSIL